MDMSRGRSGRRGRRHAERADQAGYRECGE